MDHTDVIAQYLDQIHHHIATHGWSIQVTPHPDAELDQMLAYTVGLFLQDLPELVMVCGPTPPDVQLTGYLLNKTASILTHTPTTEFSPHIDVPMDDTDPPADIRVRVEPSHHTPDLNVVHLLARVHDQHSPRALTLTMT